MAPATASDMRPHPALLGPTSSLAQVWTSDSFASWLEEQPVPYELIKGYVLMSPSPSRFHQKLAARLFGLLFQFVEVNPVGELVYESGWKVDEGTYLIPDIMLILPSEVERLLTVNPSGKDYRGITPALVIEVLSPYHKGRDLVDKFRIYKENGVQEYWIFDPEERRAQFFQRTKGGFEEIAVANNSFSTSRVLPGFSLDLEAFWKAVK